MQQGLTAAGVLAMTKLICCSKILTLLKSSTGTQACLKLVLKLFMQMLCLELTLPFLICRNFPFLNANNLMSLHKASWEFSQYQKPPSMCVRGL